MAEAPGGALPTLEEAQGWVGYRLDELRGSSIARVHGVLVDAEGGGPEWLVVKLGRFGRTTALPLRDCAGGAGHVWCAYERERIRSAPPIEPDEPLTRERELEFCGHYGPGQDRGRAAEVSNRPEGAVTAHPRPTPSGPTGRGRARSPSAGPHRSPRRW